MKTYTYQAPLGKGSTKICEIKNSNGEIIGSIQRYFNNRFHRTIDSLWGQNNYFVRIKARDPEGNEVIDAVRKNYWLGKPDNYIHFTGGSLEGKTFHARQTNNIIINPEYFIKHNNIEITSKTSSFDWVRFYQDGQEIARWQTRAKERYKTYVKINNQASVQDPLFYAILGQMLY